MGNDGSVIDKALEASGERWVGRIADEVAPGRFRSRASIPGFGQFLPVAGGGVGSETLGGIGASSALALFTLPLGLARVTAGV